MEAAFRLIERITIAIAAVAVLAAGTIICINVVGRATIGFNIPDAEIIIQDLMVVAVLLPTLRQQPNHQHDHKQHQHQQHQQQLMQYVVSRLTGLMCCSC